MTDVSGKLPDDHPMMVAWRAFQQTPDYENSCRWAADDAARAGSMWHMFSTGWTAALSALRPGDRIGDGLVVMPVEPTEAMGRAGLHVLDHKGLGDCNCSQWDVYTAMRDAAKEG